MAAHTTSPPDAPGAPALETVVVAVEVGVVDVEVVDRVVVLLLLVLVVLVDVVVWVAVVSAVVPLPVEKKEQKPSNATTAEYAVGLAAVFAQGAHAVARSSSSVVKLVDPLSVV